MATIAEVKDLLGYKNLNFSRQLNDDKSPSEWLRAWDNDNRVAVCMHEDVMKAIKDNPDISSLGTKTTEDKVSKPKTAPDPKNPNKTIIVPGEPYVNHTIVNYTSVEFSI